MREVVREVECFPRSLLVGRLRERGRREHGAHRVGGAGENLLRGRSWANPREELDVVSGDEPVELELPRLPCAGHGPDPPDVARVVAVIRRSVHEDELARLERRGLRPVVPVPDVRPAATIGSYAEPNAPPRRKTSSASAPSSYSITPGAVERIASRTARPVNRAASRMTPISHVLFTQRSRSRNGLRSRTSTVGNRIGVPRRIRPRTTLSPRTGRPGTPP